MTGIYQLFKNIYFLLLNFNMFHKVLQMMVMMMIGCQSALVTLVVSPLMRLQQKVNSDEANARRVTSFQLTPVASK